MYCTAISAALCMEIWSLYCFLRAVWVERNARRGLLWAFFGSLFGALAFGCRPPVALANLLVLPMLVEYLRFDFPFEFGQSYQLTNTDQSHYGLSGNGVSAVYIFNQMSAQLFRPPQFTSAFPHVTFQSFFGNFPILLFSLWTLLDRELRVRLKRLRLMPFYLTAMAAVLLILFADLIYSPFFAERYRTDICWLMALATFIAFGCQFVKQAEADPELPGSLSGTSSLVCLCSLLTIASAFLFFLIPNDDNFTAHFPDILIKIERVLKAVN